MGIKRHAFEIGTRIGVDRATGKMVGFAADHALDGGGLANFSVSVASISALAALGIYYVPKVDLTTYVYHSRRDGWLDAWLRYPTDHDRA